MSKVLGLLPGVAFVAVLVRFLWVPTWPGVVALAVASGLLILDGWRRGVLPRLEELNRRVDDLGRDVTEIKPKVTQVLNRGGGR